MVETYAADDETVTLTGTLQSIFNGAFRLDAGPREIRVDTSTMHYDPTLHEGDRVSVYGENGRRGLVRGAHGRGG